MDEYKPNGGDYIPMERWGKDHWSTFAYLETVATDRDGHIDRQRMRCNARLHRELANVSPWNSLVDGGEYPTRLIDGNLEKHDDWSCVEDMVAAGLVRAFFRQENYDRAFGNTEAYIELTDEGWRIAAELRQHKAQGGVYHGFRPVKELSHAVN